MGASAKNIDFSNVKEGGNFNKARIPAGDYEAIITKVEDAESAKDKVAQYLFSIKIVSRSSAVFPYYCKLQENQLWKLRNIMIAAGKAVPKRRTKVDPNIIVNKRIGVSIEDTEYDGKEQSEIAGVFPAADLVDAGPGAEEEPEEDEEDAPLEDDEAPVDDTEDEAEEEEAEDEVEADDEEEAEEEPDEFAGLDEAALRTALKAAIKKHDSSFVAKKSQTNDDLREILNGHTNQPEKASKAPAAAKKAAPAAKKAAAKKPAADVSDDELEELDIDDL